MRVFCLILIYVYILSMKKSRLIISLAILTLFVGIWILGRSGSNRSILSPPDPGFAQYVSAYSGGSQSAYDPIRCVFTLDIPDAVRKQMPADKAQGNEWF